MSDEQLPLNDAPDTATSEVSSVVDSHSAPAGDSSPGGFSTPYEAFRHLPEFQGQDDLAIAQNLYKAFNGYQTASQQLQQYQSVIPAASEYLRNQREFEAWKKSQAEAARPKPAEAPKWWNPPQIKDTYKSFIVRDPQTGKEVIDPSAPYEAQQALREYQAYTADFARKFVTDPENTLKPFIEQVAMQKAQELVANQLGQYRATEYVSSLEQQNSDWLYDQGGQITREGQAIQAYIQQASEIGITSPEARWKYATGMLQRDLLNLRYRQMQGMLSQPAPMPMAPPPPAVDPNMQFLRERATRAPNRSAGSTEPRAPRQRMSFEERLKHQLATDGVI
jgi:hypothetical protein